MGRWVADRTARRERRRPAGCRDRWAARPGRRPRRRAWRGRDRWAHREASNRRRGATLGHWPRDGRAPRRTVRRDRLAVARHEAAPGAPRSPCGAPVRAAPGLVASGRVGSGREALRPASAPGPVAPVRPAERAGAWARTTRVRPGVGRPPAAAVRAGPASAAAVRVALPGTDRVAAERPMAARWPRRAAIPAGRPDPPCPCDRAGQPVARVRGRRRAGRRAGTAGRRAPGRRPGPDRRAAGRSVGSGRSVGAGRPVEAGRHADPSRRPGPVGCVAPPRADGRAPGRSPVPRRRAPPAARTAPRTRSDRPLRAWPAPAGAPVRSTSARSRPARTAGLRDRLSRRPPLAPTRIGKPGRSHPTPTSAGVDRPGCGLDPPGPLPAQFAGHPVVEVRHLAVARHDRGRPAPGPADLETYP